MIMSREDGGFIRVFVYAFMRVERYEMRVARCGLRCGLRDAGYGGGRGLRDKSGLLHIKVLLS